MNKIKFLIALFAIALINGCSDDGTETPVGSLHLQIVRVGTFDLSTAPGAENKGAPIDKPVVITFAEALNPASASNEITLQEGATAVPSTFNFNDNDKVVSMQPDQELKPGTIYTLVITDKLVGADKETFPGLTITFKTEAGELKIESWTIDTQTVATGKITNVSLTPDIVVNFDRAVDKSSVTPTTILLSGKSPGTPQFAFTNDDKTLTITPSNTLDHFNQYQVTITDQVKGSQGEVFAGKSSKFYTAVDPAPKFPVVTDDELLTIVQQQTFKYFWDFAQSNSGMARERNTSGNLVTTGGSGFGIMAIIVGIERGFITRAQGLERIDKILDFLETSDRFHGVWPHWIDGNTGDVIPFSTNDNGGDLVETSFLVQGLLTFRQYLNAGDSNEQSLINRINNLWQSVEWDWYTRGGQNVLYWHWSPDKDWIMNHQIQGWNECLITYVLAASSTTHTIAKDVYTQGFARNGAIVNGKSFYGITLPLGSDYGGPLFFTHYSFMGLDPRNLSDTYANYWTQNTHHALINYKYCVANPLNYVGYGENNWGLTASDNHQGYSAHSPTNDLGVITPTAALSSLPYTPDESLNALKFFYYTLGDKLWGPYGFYDAYNVTQGWYATSTLAIDQGPIIVMIENYRTGLLWDLFMSAPEVQSGLTKLGFTY